MKTCHAFLLTAALAMLMASCGDTEKDAARQMLGRARTEYRAGRYDNALAVIDSLRRQHPTAIEERREALALWQDATEKKAQRRVALLDQQIQAVARTADSLQRVINAGDATANQLLSLNRLRLQKDSLQSEFDAQCALVRLVRQKRNS